jgi:hypothetical protein
LNIGQALGKYTKTYVNVGFLGSNVDMDERWISKLESIFKKPEIT